MLFCAHAFFKGMLLMMMNKQEDINLRGEKIIK